MTGLAYEAQAILGTAVAVDGLACTPTGPASLNVLLGPGSIYGPESLEASAWSSLPVNTTESIVKQGILHANDQIGIVPPSTSGFSQVFLIEVQYADLDTNPMLLPYFNAANPAQPFQGPNNSGTSNNTVRLGIVAVQVKAGIAATTGTQVAPTPDAGWTGLWLVTLSNGQSTITSGNIAQYPGAPFIPVKLPNVPAGVQNSAWTGYDDTGNVNSIVITPSPPISAYAKYQAWRVKIAHTNTSSVVANISGVGSRPVVTYGGAAFVGGELVLGNILELVDDGTSLRVATGAASSGIPTNTTTYTAAGTYTYTVPPGIFRIYVKMLGAGGGGGGSTATTTAGGAGGGAGGYSEGSFAVVPGQTLTVIVGAAGAGGTNAPTGGGNGGTTSITALGISCTGGSGGGGSGGGSGGSGVGSGGQINYQGYPGGLSITYVSGVTYAGGIGGSPYGFSINSGSVSAAGPNGAFPGCGGDGSSANASGGSGHDGQVIIQC